MNLSFRLVNVGQRAAFEVGGHIFVLTRPPAGLGQELTRAPEQKAEFSLASELAQGSDVLSRPAGLVCEAITQPAYMVVVVSYVDAVLKRAFTSWFTFNLEPAPRQPDGFQGPLHVAECPLEEEEQVFAYLNQWFPGLLQNGTYADQVAAVRSADERRVELSS